MKKKVFNRRQLTEVERRKRKRFLSATLVTCAAIAMVGGAIHVVDIGHGRVFSDMPSMASYDIADMESRIRAAGEDIVMHERNEGSKPKIYHYSESELVELVGVEQWQDINQMLTIPAGLFLMGSDRIRTSDQNRPQHKISLPAYQIAKYPTTNVQYAQFVSEQSYRPPLDWVDGKVPQDEALYPVTMISWYDASNFCNWANKRLPTEAEWEKAARGEDGRRWPWGELMETSRLNTYYRVGSATDVTRFPEGASPYGVMDMAGNVSEWLETDFMPYTGSTAGKEVFQGKIQVASTPADRAMKVVDLVGVDAKYKVLRGGSWKSDPFSTTTYHRNFSWPHYASDFFGFRCAANIVEKDEG